MASRKQYAVEITRKHSLAGRILFNTIVALLALWLGFWQSQAKINVYQVMAAGSGCGHVCAKSIPNVMPKSPKRMVEITPSIILLVTALETPFVSSSICLWDGQHLLASDTSLRLLQRPPPLVPSLS